MTSSDHCTSYFLSLNLHREDIYEYVSDTKDKASFHLLPAFLLKIVDLDLKQQCGCSCCLGMGKCSLV